jgi:hypothetical protein
MDPRRFDALTKSLSPTGTRRALLRRLAAVSLAGVFAVFLGRETTQADGSGAIVGGGGGLPDPEWQPVLRRQSALLRRGAGR